MKKLAIVCAATLLVVAALATGAFYAARAILAPLPGEWSVPLKFGPLELQAGVPSVIRLATSPWGGPLLDGHEFATRVGRLHLDWQSSNSTLLLRCAPCILQPPGLGEESLQLDQVLTSVRRNGGRLYGEVVSGRVRGTWEGRLAQGELPLRLSIPGTQLADGYALFARHIPEVTQAQIGGVFSLQAQLSLPSGTLTIAPRIEGFEVSGLGTEALAGARSSCTTGRRTSRLTPDSWLARAAVAAEDQRFFEHQGYDLTELASSLTRNQQMHRIERGGSTLSQQVAKLLLTGDERSPVRKLRELLYAVEMERTLGKPRILRLYLDNAPWGPRLCGAEAAAVHYFGVRAHELTPAQAAWLAAMLHNPVMEAQRWADTGQINMARAQWVAMGMRGLTRKQKLTLVEDMAARDWPATWAEPPPLPAPSTTPRKGRQAVED
ncbi:biosynthetic peptidoglycan transglycosylase [Caenimonas soli]|uniref:biosynthetic peptidoglycan transglycosylase n=1 Tax=Caenimonas soli TaxID=2735555 RepID=UPI001551D92D|nr:biosynthetic peptidoglycan transglycosylase [Caenimonas soli]NPC55220.1 transglycosylase domain-containing protein [Caenimonas soli]